MRKHSRAALRGSLNGALRLAAVVVLSLALAIPAYAYWRTTRGPVYGLAPQVDVRLPAPTSPRRPIPAYAGGVLVLSYQDISATRRDPGAVTPAAFAAQMASLHAAGFHAITAAQFATFLEGRDRLPSRPLLITFDDGTKGTWIYADRVLRRLDYRATAFLIAGDVSAHQPYYLDWKEVETMAGNGRWSFGSHTAWGNGLIVTHRDGEEGPFMANRQWLGGRRRFETLREYGNRVALDLLRSVVLMKQHGLRRPPLFSYPFAPAAEPTNDPRTGPLLERMLARRFAGSLDDSTVPTLVRSGATGPLPRLVVDRRTTPAQLLAEAAGAIARRP